MIGRMLGHYQVVEEIGSGGMGIVYKARDMHLDRFVALKILPPEKTADPERKRRFVQEAKAASALNHSNIVHIYDIASDAGVDFIAMEFVEGKTLDEVIGHRGLSVKDTLKLAIQISDALAKAHSAGIIHRDLKPSNIMVNEAGVVKILDFGLAKLVEKVQGDEFASTASIGAEGKPITEKGAIIGTVAYMSPEQAEGKVVDTRSDIFSFGSLLYEMITGRRAFQGSNRISTLSAILEKEPAPLGVEIPRDLEKVITRCLRKDPARRFQNMADLKVTLEELKEESDSRNLSSLSAPAEPIPARGWFLRKSAILPIILAAVLASAAWLYFRSRPGPPGDSTVSQVTPGGKLTLLFSAQGDASGPALSPDGKMLAFVAEVQGRWDLFVGRVAGGERIRLTDDAAQESMPGFSPDGERIVYTRTGTGVELSEIWVVPTLGGQANRVLGSALDAAWSPDGKRLAFILRRQGKADAIAVSAADGSALSIVMEADSDYPFFRAVAWSPQGEDLAVARSSGGMASELWLVPLSGRPPRRLFSDPPGVFSQKPVFTPDGKALVHQSNRAGATNLWLLPLDGGQPVRLTFGPGPDTMPSVSRDGSIAFLNTRARSYLSVIDLTSGRRREVFGHSSYIWAPAFSPSGRELAFSRAEADGSWHIWAAKLEGGAARQLTSGALPEVYPRFTPDGGSVIYHTWSPGPDRIWRVPLAGGPPVPLTPERDDDDQYGDISPDGRWLAFARTENKITRIYIAPASGGEARRLTDSVSTLPHWSPDGQWIAFSRSRGDIDGISVIRADGTGMRQLSETGGWPVWWPGGKQIACLSPGRDGFDDLKIVSFDGVPSGKRQPARLSGLTYPFDISPDGSLLATSAGSVISSDIWLLEPAR